MGRRLVQLALSFVGMLLLATPALASEAGAKSLGEELSLLWVVPFAGILLSIALFPLIKPDFWHHHYGKIALFWALSFLIPFSVRDWHVALSEVLHVYVLEFIPFIILLWALYTVAGGVRLRGRLRGSPLMNCGILLLGTVLASWMGTTGAAMLLIRPLLRANEWRKRKVHLVVFFIFLVANIGGSLTPLGDPPLFLGFLHGVEFFWTTTHMFLPMLVCVAVLLVVFFVLDTIALSKEESKTPPEDGSGEALGLEGMHNFVFLIGIVVAILYSGSASKSETYYDESHITNAEHVHEVEHLTHEKDKIDQELKALLAGNDKEAAKKKLRERLVAEGKVNKVRANAEHHAVKGWHIGDTHVTFPYVNMVRDGILVLMGILSLLTTKKETRRKNDFTWFPIVEVGKLFAGIFVTIIPAIAILKAGPLGALDSVVMAVTASNGDPLNPMYFWFTGVLSSFLDNAPTYLVFFNTAGGDATYLMSGGAKTLLAISAGAVFMGANTYIGNAPNFMVRSIAEESGVPMPSFFGYIFKWSLIFLVPTFILISFLFF